MTLISGVVPATVKSLDDPDKLGRIQVSFDWMAESKPLSYWARIAAPMAGAGRGFQFMPEEKDEVLVAFDHGDLRLPYIVGFLWNGEEKPPRTEPKQRVIQTVSGHLIELDDTEGSEKIALSFKGGNPSITLDKDAITLRFSDSSYIELSAAEIKIVNTTLVNINP